MSLRRRRRFRRRSRPRTAAPGAVTLAALAFAALALAGCSDLEPVERRNAEGVVVERYTRTRGDSLMQGLYQAFDPEGELVEEANYAAGQLDGERTLYYPGGAVQYVEQHRGGIFEGTYRAYYPDGQLELTGEYAANAMTGVWTGYYPNGTKKEEVTFVDNQENGPFREWYSNGVLKAEGTYRDGDNEQGELTLYNLAGEVERVMYCDAGVCRTVMQAGASGDDSTGDRPAGPPALPAAADIDADAP